MRRLHRALFGCLLFWAAALIVILVEAREDEILLLVAAPMPTSLFAGLLPYWLVWKSPLREQMLWSDLSLSGSAVALGNFALPRFLGCADTARDDCMTAGAEHAELWDIVWLRQTWAQTRYDNKVMTTGRAGGLHWPPLGPVAGGAYMFIGTPSPAHLALPLWK